MRSTASQIKAPEGRPGSSEQIQAIADGRRGQSLLAGRAGPSRRERNDSRRFQIGQGFRPPSTQTSQLTAPPRSSSILGNVLTLASFNRNPRQAFPCPQLRHRRGKRNPHPAESRHEACARSRRRRRRGYPRSQGVSKPRLHGEDSTLVEIMAGSLETIKPLDLMQLFCGANKSGVLILIRENERGEIHLNKGEIYDAEVRGKDSLPPRRSRRERADSGTDSRGGTADGRGKLSPAIRILQNARTKRPFQNLGTCEPLRRRQSSRTTRPIDR